jgi:hypothetical protein
MCCLLRATSYLRTSGVSDVSVWSNAGMMISRERAKNLEEKPAPVSLSPQISRELTRDRARDSEVRSQQVTLEIYRMVAYFKFVRYSSLEDSSHGVFLCSSLGGTR